MTQSLRGGKQKCIPILKFYIMKVYVHEYGNHNFRMYILWDVQIIILVNEIFPVKFEQWIM